MQDTWASWAAIAGSMGTLAIAILALLSIRIARRSLRLMEQREERSHPALEIFHMGSYLKRHRERDSRVYAVNVRISNLSDTNNSVKDLSLKINFKHEGGITSNVLIPPSKASDERLTALMDIDSADILAIPLPLRPHTVVNGWALFEIRNETLGDYRIENYEVTIVDSNNITSSLEILLINERL